jgi:hypothetical protein
MRRYAFVPQAGLGRAEYNLGVDGNSGVGSSFQHSRFRLHHFKKSWLAITHFRAFQHGCAFRT